MPTIGTSMRLCFYDDNALVQSSLIEAGGTCDGKPCWKESKKGFKFKDKLGSQSGIAAVKMKEGEGRAKILVRGKGANLKLPTLPLSQFSDVTVQLVKTRQASSMCWESVFDTPAVKSTSSLFKDSDR